MTKSLYAIFGGCRKRAESQRRIPAALFCLLLSAFSLPPAQAQPSVKLPPPDLVDRVGVRYGFSAREISDLKTNGEITRFRKEATGRFLVPDGPIGDALSAKLQAINPTLVVEAIFVLPLAERQAKSANLELVVFNTLRSVSTMKGIEYYSASRKRMRVMFEDAFVVADPESRTPLPDPVERHVLPESLIYVFQNDSSFGKNAYEALYQRHGSTVQVSMKNLSEMYYSIVPLVEPGHLLLDLVVKPAEDHILFYGCIGVKTYGLFGLEKKTHDSFYNRIKALFGWFSREFEKNLR